MRSERIEEFIDENKALMRRMYGDFETIPEYGLPNPGATRKKRQAANRPRVPDILEPFEHMLPTGRPRVPENVTPAGESFFHHLRDKRQNPIRGSPVRPNVGPNPSSEPHSSR